MCHEPSAGVQYVASPHRNAVDSLIARNYRPAENAGTPFVERPAAGATAEPAVTLGAALIPFRNRDRTAFDGFHLANPFRRRPITHTERPRTRTGASEQERAQANKDGHQRTRTGTSDSGTHSADSGHSVSRRQRIAMLDVPRRCA
jgi:hypothetical protein